MRFAAAALLRHAAAADAAFVMRAITPDAIITLFRHDDAISFSY